ncbi:MAG: preprotein translocase subunit SecG [Paludibacteraceae bacterium]|nr:preprotein translocase subunit SecG [Paludibacteraceae bacterium]
MYTFFTILIVIASILLILIVLVQNSKGGGLASGFSSSNNIMGVRKTTDFLEKTTWILATVVILLSILAVGVKSGDTLVNESQIKEQVLEQQEAMQNAAATPDFSEQAEGEEAAE